MRIFKDGGHRLFETDPETSRVVSELLIELERDGMDAVRKYSQKFDEWNPKSFELTEKQIENSIAVLDNQIIEDTDLCQSNVRRFAKAQLSTMTELEYDLGGGITLGHKHIPVTNVGSYVPGGIYPMYGSAQMSIIPAKVAGVETVVACTPPVKGQGYYGATINAMKKAGADRIFVLGGVQAFAMMAFGMGEVEPVDILCGAGNKYVAEAKRQLFGRCGIDLLAGPTEMMIIADDSADPKMTACDILGQAEHDPNTGLALVCFSEKFAQETLKELEVQLEVLPTKEVAEVSWANNGRIYIADSADEAISISDDYAPEHLHIMVDDEDYYHKRLRNYGSLFIGEEVSVTYGDKSIGTNHILPTSRAAKYTGGVWVGCFLKTVTYQKMTKEASVNLGEVTERQCVIEHMLAHGLAAKMRVEKYK